MARAKTITVNGTKRKVLGDMFGTGNSGKASEGFSITSSAGGKTSKVTRKQYDVARANAGKKGDDRYNY